MLREEEMEVVVRSKFITKLKSITTFLSCILAASFLHNYGCASAMVLPKNVKIPAILVFGDSIVDSGNNNYINTIGRANFPPYGRDFEGGIPSGRFSNGKVPSDLLAEELGIKELVPPYLDPSLQINDLLTGVSFASAAAGFDPISSQTVNYGGAIAMVLPENVTIPAILVFGDSIVDPGNNDYIDTVGKANFPPYGRDFEGGIATGRYSNGKIPSDLLAEEFGVKELVPPYLNRSLQIKDLLTGVSFASGASGYDPISPKIANTLSLDDELKLFKEYINKLKNAVGENTTSTILSQSVYLIFSGSNDITNTYFSSPFRRFQYNISTYTDMLLKWSTTFVQELYDLGARRIALTNAPPCGCLPSQRTFQGGPMRECSVEENQAAVLFNDKLRSRLTSLNHNLPGSKIAYLDIYTPLLELIMHPTRYGFEVADKGCCGTGNIEVSFLCNKLDIGTCKDASKYIFWDSFHPTENAYRFLVHYIVSQKSIYDLF